MSTISVNVVSGSGWKNKEFLGKSDPYCQLSLHGQVKKTKPHNNAGTQAQWNQTLVFSGVQLGQMAVDVFDDDLGKDTILGKGVADLSMCYPGQPTPVTVQLSPAGQVQLMVTVEQPYSGASQTYGHGGGYGGYGAPAQAYNQGAQGRHTVCPACGKPEDGSYHGCILSQVPPPNRKAPYGAVWVQEGPPAFMSNNFQGQQRIGPSPFGPQQFYGNQQQFGGYGSPFGPYGSQPPAMPFQPRGPPPMQAMPPAWSTPYNMTRRNSLGNSGFYDPGQNQRCPSCRNGLGTTQICSNCYQHRLRITSY